MKDISFVCNKKSYVTLTHLYTQMCHVRHDSSVRKKNPFICHTRQPHVPPTQRATVTVTATETAAETETETPTATDTEYIYIHVYIHIYVCIHINT